MLSFFPDVVEPPITEQLDDTGSRRDPEWAGPPRDQRPGIAALAVEIGRSDSTVVMFEGARVYSQGAVLVLAVRTSETGLAARRHLHTQLDLHHGRGQLNLFLPIGGLRWGLQFSDGRKVTSLDDSGWVTLPEGTDPAAWAPDRPHLDGASRPSAVADSWRRDMWLWPLPPPGDLLVVCAWPDRGIAETSTIIDSDLLLEAAGRAEPLWP